MNLLFILISSLFLLWIVRDIFFWITVWQENEYRFDRFFASLKGKQLKKRILLSPLFLPKWTLLFLFGFVVINDMYLSFYQYAIAGLYLVQLLIIGDELYRNKLKKPALDLRSLLLIFLTLATVFFFLSIPLVDKFFWLLLIDTLVPLIILCFVSLFSFPSEIYSDWRLDKALKRLRKNPDMIVIAITGSNGKSLMTEYVAHILSQKFKVVRTHRANNTSDEIAKTILSRLQSDTEIFVAEIKAYRPGEIRALCEVIRPTIGVLTPITSQYLNLFKTLENIKKTNNELVESLPKKGCCFFSGNSANTQALYKSSKKTKRLYVNLQTLKKPIDTDDENTIYASHIVQVGKHISFTVKLNQKIMRFQVASNLSIEYLLPGISIADSLGMKESDIRKALRALK